MGPRVYAPAGLHLLGLFLLAQDLWMLGVGGYFGGKSLYLVTSGEVAQGTVVAMDVGSKGSASPVVEFTAKDGQRVRFDGTVSAKPPNHHIGQKVRVHYSPQQPSFAVIDTFSEMWLLPTILGCVSIAMSALGGGFAVVGFRRKRARARIMASGWHVYGSVVGAEPIKMKNSTHYEPIVEVVDPQTNAPTQCWGDRQPARPIVGSQAMVHIESTPPHRYFVELMR